jgi:very-short-patch-repair endonuclease
MPPKNIVIGLKVDPEKTARAKEFRREMTAAEKILWGSLRTNRLDGYHFRRQQVIAGFIVDFYCHAAGLAVELDGPVHARQVDYDRDRDRVLNEIGVRVLRFRNEEVMENLEAVLTAIREACRGVT